MMVNDNIKLWLVGPFNLDNEGNWDSSCIYRKIMQVTVLGLGMSIAFTD